MVAAVQMRGNDGLLRVVSGIASKYLGGRMIGRVCLHMRDGEEGGQDDGPELCLDQLCKYCLLLITELENSRFGEEDNAQFFS